jgi:hypothetical protein
VAVRTRPGTALATTDRTVVGTQAEVATAIAQLRVCGLLVAASAARPMPGERRRVLVRVRLVDVTVAAPAAAAPWYRRPRVVLPVVTTAVAVLVGMGYGLYLLGQALARAVTAAAPTVGGVLFILVVVWLMLGRSGR